MWPLRATSEGKMRMPYPCREKKPPRVARRSRRHAEVELRCERPYLLPDLTGPVATRQFLHPAAYRMKLRGLGQGDSCAMGHDGAAVNIHILQRLSCASAASSLLTSACSEYCTVFLASGRNGAAVAVQSFSSLTATVHARAHSKFYLTEAHALHVPPQ